MDRLHLPSPSLPSKNIHSAHSPSPYIAHYDADDGGPSRDEKPSPRRSDKQFDSDIQDKSSAKKPRHRHSPVQLAALNELFERSEHPLLEERTDLAERLGMETKTVNAWFQNKRASTKKRNKTIPIESTPPAASDPVPHKSSKQPPQSNLPSIANLLNSAHPVPAAQLPPQPSRPRSSTRKSRQKDLHLNDHILADPTLSTTSSQTSAQETALESTFFAGPSELFGQDRFILSHHRGHDPETAAVHVLHNSDSDRVLPDADSRFQECVPPQNRQTNYAAFYATNDHPTREQRQELADRIGMRLQSVTNWFQNQRSQAKKHKEDPSFTPDVAPRQPFGSGDGLTSSRLHHPPLPPRSHHPSLMIPEHDSRSVSLRLSSAVSDESRSVSTPRSRMSLPPPSLSSRMSSPRIRRSILPYARDSKDLHFDEEERSALALEIGMDIGKVLQLESANPHEHDVSSGSSVYDDDDAMDLVYEDIMDEDMDERSEEEYQEAVTPFTDVSSSPPPNKRQRPGDDAMVSMDDGIIESVCLPGL
ncbi:hypothetical protein JVU11DRAFT_4744 [Chiua virens]|nr:hypothetical protein JVU11DRAFT_4744 [Chiua virens]